MFNNRLIYLYIGVSIGVFGLGFAAGYLVRDRVVSSEQAIAQSETATAPEQASPQNTERKVTRYEVPVDDDPSLGPIDAPITIIEFGDYECPFCRKWYIEVLPKLMDKYPQKIRFVYRDFPLTSIHGNAMSAAEAAHCAGEQDAYWQFHEKLFSMDLGLSTEAYQQYARQLKLDMDAFEACLQERRYQEEVEADFDFAARLGVRSTPTFFINGIAIVGAQPSEVFEQVIDLELAGELE
jgi:protein-disulfide isomerase